MEPSLQKAIDNLVGGIQEYESDTFSASAEGVSRKEAELAAAVLIQKFLFDDNLCPGDSVDGVVVGSAIRMVR